MHIAILNTQTDTSAFSQLYPDDGRKFAALISAVRPDWRYDVFAVKEDVFPADIAVYDGVLITGSIASVHDDKVWITRLQALVREIVAQDIPLYGACFGHQIIAAALGGKIEKNPKGWSFGVVDVEAVETPSWMEPACQTSHLYSAHIEQVAVLPAGARVIASQAMTPIAGFAIGDNVATTQYHPEIDREFFAGLIAEFGDEFPPEVTQQAKNELDRPTDSQIYAEWMARFFEQAK